MPQVSKRVEDCRQFHPETITWLDGLFGRDEGIVHAPRGVGGHRGRSGSYDFETWKPHFFQWPQERRQLLSHIARHSRLDDVYVAPRLLSERVASPQYALPGSWLYSDVDHDLTGDQRRAYEELCTGEHFLVRSGSGNNFHLYLHLDEVLDPDQLMTLNRRLALTLGGEKYEANAVLRPPGSFNHKNAVEGGEPSDVVLDAGPRVTQPWSVAELEHRLTPLPLPVTEPATSWRSLEELPQLLAGLVAESPIEERRSHQFFHLVMTAIEAGYDETDILELAMMHLPTTEKWKPYQIERRVRDLCEQHSHPGSTCGSVDCPNATAGQTGRTQVARQIAAFRQAVDAFPWPPRRTAMREIVLAACQFAEEFGRLEFFLSERDMALLAHVSRATVSRWLPDLGDWLTQTAAGSGRNAAGWRLHAPQHGPQLLQPPVPNTHGVCGPSWGPEADAFRHGGLGGNAKRLYFGPLAVGKPTARQAALELALAESTARSNLNRLEAAGLAERNDDGRWQRIAATPERWSVIALKLNRLGADSRQEARVIHERRARYERAAERYRRRAARYRRRGLRGFASYWECAARIEERAAERQAGQRGGAVDTVDQQRARTTIAGEIGRRSQQRRDNKWSD